MFGKLKKVDLRKGWKSEASDFTQWLAKEENLAILSDEIGIDIKLEQTEAKFGKFKADILAKEENTGRKIIIENQLETTDHKHLGQLITYTSGHDAKIVIWIVKDVREEHRQAIDWLNEHTDEETYFFVVKIELWKIGDSPPAPKFQIISRPNEWSKALKSAEKSTLTETKLLQKDFWDKFKEYAQSKGARLSLRKTSPQHWYDISLGSSDAHISLTVNTQENLLGCEVYIQDAKVIFHELYKLRDKIEDELGFRMNWMPLETKKASRIKLTREGDINNQEKCNEYFEWFKEHAEKIHKVFPKYLKKLKDKRTVRI